jgi:hypothetical protein
MEKNREELDKGIVRFFENDEEIYEVTTKDGIFLMKEVEYNKIRSAIKRGQPSDKEELCILSELIFKKDGEEKSIGELELGSYKGSTIVRLSKAMNMLVDVSDFQKVSSLN